MSSRAELEVAGVVALVELLAFVAGELVDDPAALDRGAGVDLARPAHHMLIFVRGQELVGAWIGAAERDAAVPRPDRDVGDGVIGTGDIFALARGGG